MAWVPQSRVRRQRTCTAATRHSGGRLLVVLLGLEAVAAARGSCLERVAVAVVSGCPRLLACGPRCRLNEGSSRFRRVNEPAVVCGWSLLLPWLLYRLVLRGHQ